MNKLEYAARKLSGKCVQCGRADPLVTTTMCDPCRTRIAKSSYRIRKEERSQGLCVYCKQQARPNRQTCLKCSKVDYNYNQTHKLKLQKQAFDAYGNMCSCCGQNDVTFLQIDHIDGGGNKHRKEIGGTSLAIYRFLRNNNYPSNFQILCADCNFAKGLKHGCPHRNEPDFIMSPSKFKTMWGVPCL